MATPAGAVVIEVVRDRAQVVFGGCPLMRVSRGFHGRRHFGAESARVPPGQYVINDFPVLSAGPTPHTPLSDWNFTIRGAVDHPISWTWDESRHCQARRSRLTSTV
jgi:DMSO/TMAO reductase YedYZ molybdopterin-dependent catalytic subunit